MRISDWSSDVCSSDLFVFFVLDEFRIILDAVEELSKLLKHFLVCPRINILVDRVLLQNTFPYVYFYMGSCYLLAGGEPVEPSFCLYPDRKSTRLNSSH